MEIQQKSAKLHNKLQLFFITAISYKIVLTLQIQAFHFFLLSTQEEIELRSRPQTVCMTFLNLLYHSHANYVLIGRSLVIATTWPAKILIYTTIGRMMGTKQI